MKLITFWVTILFSSLATAQTNQIAPQKGTEKVKDILIETMQKDGTLLTDAEIACTSDCVWDIKKPFLSTQEGRKEKFLKKNNYIKNLLLNKFLQTFITDNESLSEYQFQMALCKLGSCIISSGNFTPIKNSAFNPQLSIFNNGKQIQFQAPPNIMVPNFVLNYTTDKTFKLINETEVNAQYLSYFQAQEKIAYKKTEETKQSLHLAIGVFNNELGEIFDRASLTNANSYEFGPLYEVWLLRSKNRITTTDSIIRSFKGLVYRTTMGYDRSENLNSSGKFEAGGNAQFIGGKTTTNVSFDNASKVSYSGNNYDILMFQRPNMISVPTATEIEDNWNRLSKTSQIISSLQTIPNPEPLPITLTFGPVPNNDAIQSIDIDANYTKNKMTNKFIDRLEIVRQGINEPKFNPDNYTVTLTINVYPDQAYIDQTAILSDFFSEKIDLKLYYNHPINQKYLTFLYPPFVVKADRRPIISIIDDNHKGKLTAVKKGNFYEYEFNGEFLVRNGQNITKSPAPQIKEVKNFPSQLTIQQRNLLQDAIKAAIFVQNSNRFTGTIRIPVTENIFSSNTTEISNLELAMQFNDGTKNFTKSFQLSLAAPSEKIIIDPSIITDISFDKLTDLINSLNYKSILSIDSIIISDKTYNLHTEWDILIKDIEPFALIEILKSINQQFNVYFINSKYYIKSVFIDAEKHKKSLL
jgi:hypothetical protein